MSDRRPDRSLDKPVELSAEAFATWQQERREYREYLKKRYPERYQLAIAKQALERIARFETDHGPVAEVDRGGALATYARRVLSDLTSVAV